MPWRLAMPLIVSPALTTWWVAPVRVGVTPLERGVLVPPDPPEPEPGTVRRWPTRMRLALPIPFSETSEEMAVPCRAASRPRVSPERTVEDSVAGGAPAGGDRGWP